MSKNSEIYDVIIIGGGPAGLSAALYTARATLKTLVIDKSPSAGALGLASKIQNYPGIPGTSTGEEILNVMRDQAREFGAEYIQEQVVGVNFTKEMKEIFTSKNQYTGKAVIVATGSMGRKPGIPGEQELMGRGVSKCATCDAFFFQQKTVALLVSSIEVALEELPTLLNFIGKAYFFSYKSLTEEQRTYLEGEENVIVMEKARVQEIIGENEVEAIKYKDNTGELKTISVEGVFLYLQGNVPIVDFLEGALSLSDKGCIDVDPHTMQTSRPAVFAAGDVTCKEIRQAILASAEGVIAALSAEKYVNQKKGYKFQWS